MFLAFLAATALGADGLSLAEAMDVPTADIASTALQGQTTMMDTIPSLGVVSPQSGSSMALLYTGVIEYDGSGLPALNPEPGFDVGSENQNWGPAGDRSELSLELQVPANAHSMRLSFNFFSAEYPEFVGSSYNDSFTAQVSGSAWSGDAAYSAAGSAVSINSVMFTVVDAASLDGTGFGATYGNIYDLAGGSTGWLTLNIPTTPGETVYLTLGVEDVFDGVYDSAVLLDNFSWSATEIDTPELGGDDNPPPDIASCEVDYLSPKRGSEVGGEITHVIGENFDPSCIALMDGVAVPTEFESQQSLRVTTRPHAPGAVDIQVECDELDPQILHNGFTYYATDGEGGIPPEIITLEPHYVSVEGGETVRLVGEFLEDVITVQMDGEEVNAAFEDGALNIIVPPHAEGAVDVTAIRPNGLSDTYFGAVLYVDLPESTDVGAESEDRKAFTDTPGCSHVGLLGGTPLLLALGALLRRRR